ncbi:hypothetical protein GF386_06875 [Candidatus Pacearchaeota archaeon]|nr:hypothetical protein [Candidatus Pacearchaeota archaeon]MBD3283804.1 hypothetical protein [Candidatus Pacearchaeota archaeon]
MSEEAIEKIMKEKISSDHLLYVSMKYTKTCDVMINLIKRWKIMMDYAFDGLLEKIKKKKLIKEIPTAPRSRLEILKEKFKDDPEVSDAIKEYEMFKLIDVLKKTKEGEFRKGVCLKVTYKGEEIEINLDKLKEYSEILERFINYTKFFLSSKA